MLSTENWVEKSKALVWAKFIDEKEKFTVGEFKLLDTYLSRINARDPDSGAVSFTRAEYCELLGLDPSMRKEQLQRYTKHFLGNSIVINRGDEWGAYSLFTTAEAKNDKDTGQVIITIKCNPDLKDIFFNLAGDGYVRYKLKNIIALEGKYAVRLYSMLKDRPFGFKVGLNELKEYLNVNTKSDRYNQFKYFSAEILKKAINEINERTDITASFEKVAQGRKVVAVKFSVKQKAPALPEPPADDMQADEPGDIPDINDRLALCASALPAHFTRNEVDYLRSLAMVHVPFEVCNLTEKELWMHDYLDSKTKLMMVQKRTVVKEKQFSWLCRAVEENWKK